jgi:hypothetical protein
MSHFKFMIVMRFQIGFGTFVDLYELNQNFSSFKADWYNKGLRF